MHVPLSSPLMNNAWEYLLLRQSARSTDLVSESRVVARRGKLASGNMGRPSQQC